MTAINTIRIGLLAPLSGLVHMYGQEICWAAKIACDEINEAGGLLGKKLELVIQDDGSLPETAVPAAFKLIDEYQCSALIGNLLSNSRIDVAYKVAEPRKIPYLNFSFYEGSISSPYFFHFAALPNQQIDKMIPYMASQFGPKMFFAGSNYEWPRGSIDACKKSLLESGGEIVGEFYIPIGSKNVETHLKDVALSGADVFVPYFAGADQISILTRFTKMGLKKRMKVVMGHYDEAMVSKLSEEVREGFYSSNTYFMNLKTQQNKSYLRRLADQPDVTGIWPYGNGILTNFGEGAYACVKAFAQSVKDAGTTDTAKLIQALKHVEIDCPQGKVTMDPDSHHATVNSYLARCDVNGEFKIITEFGRIPAVIPERYIPKIEQQTITGNEQQFVDGKLIYADPVDYTNIVAFSNIMANIDISVLATNERGIIIMANSTASKLFGYEQHELTGMSINLLLPPKYRGAHAKYVNHFLDSAHQKRLMGNRNNIFGYRKDGSEFPAEASISKFRDTHGDMILVTTINDITDRKKQEEILIWQATHDPLTHLPNRTLIYDRLNNSLDRSLRNFSNIALLFIDLDDFKMVNDSHGHSLGDTLLIEVSKRLIDAVRPGDTVARFGGDEFIILCESLKDPSVAAGIANRIANSFSNPIVIGNHILFLTASIGIAYGNGKTHSSEDLLRNADAAMYQAKANGRGKWRIFDHAIFENTIQHLAIANGLRTAIEKNEFRLHYQPIVDINTKTVVGVESLLRWFSEDGEISPSDFIPIAEITGTITQIGHWTFEQTCIEYTSWRSLCPSRTPPYLSVNLSTRQLNEPDLAEVFGNILGKYEIKPECVILEITETSLMIDVESNIRVLQELGELGLKIAVDDFGTGYSSLNQLTRMPVSHIKIDKTFIDKIDDEDGNYAIVSAIIQMARTLGLEVIAEGVEHASQFACLKKLGCNLAQGYLFCKPLPVEEFKKLLTTSDESESKTFPFANISNSN